MPALRVCCYQTPATSTKEGSPPCLSASFTDEHASHVLLSRILKASIVYSRNLIPFESFWGGTFKSIKYRIDELDEEKSVI
ncbi:hypothetical protein P3L10_019633 [Capsicum annuum]